MVEERPLPARRQTEVEVPTIPEGAPKPTPSVAIPPTMVLGYLDLALRGVLEYDRFAQVYLSPWWAVEDVPESTVVWKRAVLERVPLRGAVHWGHLYLIVSDVPADRPKFQVFRSPAVGTGQFASPEDRRFILREGVQRAELLLHPTRPDRAERLESLGREVEVRFRRQMD